MKRVRKKPLINLDLWLLVILALAVFLRFRLLGIKPPHFDEGINGHFVLNIWRDGFYTYDPTNFHGPLYFYLLHLSEVILGPGIISFRSLNAVLSVGLVALVFQFRRFFGWTAVWAAFMLAISPAFTFYGRYAIHETLFILGQALFAYGRLIWLKRPERSAVYYMAAGLVVLVSTKETFFIFIGTWVIAEICIWALEVINWKLRSRQAGLSEDMKQEIKPEKWSSWHKLSALEKKRVRLSVFGAVIVSMFSLAALFTGFFERAEGATDFFKAFNVWNKTGSNGNGHGKEFFYWIKTMWNYEWLLCVGLLVSFFALFPIRWQNRGQQILLLTGFGSFLAYSIIHYKTPWLLLSFWPLFFFITGWLQRKKIAFMLALVLIIASVHDIRKSWSLNFYHYADSSEPYVYVQTTADYNKMKKLLYDKIEVDPATKNLVVLIAVKDPWPLPYEFARFPNLRYIASGDLAKVPQSTAEADLILLDDSHFHEIERVLPKKFLKMRFHLRDAYDQGWALFDFQKFQSVAATDLEVVGGRR